MMKLVVAVTGLSLIVAGAANAQVTNSRMVGDWYLNEVRSAPLQKHDCTMQNDKFADGTTISVEMSVTTLNFTLKFENPDWTSLPSSSSSEADQQFAVVLEFEGADARYEGLFTGWRGSQTYRTRPSLYRHFRQDDLNSILAPMASAETLVVTGNGREIGRYPMNGSRAAVVNLLTCAQSALAEKNRRQNNDPFR